MSLEHGMDLDGGKRNRGESFAPSPNIIKNDQLVMWNCFWDNSDLTLTTEQRAPSHQEIEMDKITLS